MPGSSNASKEKTHLAYVSGNYQNNPVAPIDVGKWVADPQGKEYGECVSYVKSVTAGLPAARSWKKGVPVKGNPNIQPGTVIATFDTAGKYHGHAAIYESQDKDGLHVVDQWIFPPPKPVHRRLIRFGGHGLAN
jgi:hypothetical protein